MCAYTPLEPRVRATRWPEVVSGRTPNCKFKDPSPALCLLTSQGWRPPPPPLAPTAPTLRASTCYCCSCSYSSEYSIRSQTAADKSTQTAASDASKYDALPLLSFFGTRGVSNIYICAACIIHYMFGSCCCCCCCCCCRKTWESTWEETYTCIRATGAGGQTGDCVVNSSFFFSPRIGISDFFPSFLLSSLPVVYDCTSSALLCTSLPRSLARSLSVFSITIRK